MPDTPTELPWGTDCEPPSIPFEDTRDPLDKWEQPDGSWSDELTAMVAECEAGTRTTIPCPVCGRDATGLTVDYVNVEPFMLAPTFPRYTRSARVFTLAPCGHVLKR
jgi:hypothetical protein